MIDPVTLSTSFASIVGLLVNFKSGRDRISDNEFQEFMDWLEKERHEETLLKLDSNVELSKSIQMFLSQSNDEVLSQLNTIEKIILGIASRIEGFSAIATSVNPSIKMSNQAISILQQMEEVEASTFIVESMRGVDMLLFIDGKGGSFVPEEQRFVASDLTSLVEYGFLLYGHNSKGKPKYTVTREASLFVEQLTI